jgi:transcriptional regulator with XRE-family HTH domain
MVLIERHESWYRILNDNAERRVWRVRISQKFESLRDRYRRPDGTRWNGQQLQDATGGVVTRSYVSMMRKGKIENPGFDKLRAIAKAMGFPPESWFEESDGIRDAVRVEPGDGEWNVAGRLNHLFEIVKNERTGEPYSSADVARMSLGDLAEDEVERIRTGTLENPTLSQVVALADAFGVHPSYFLETGRKPALLGEQEISALADQRARAILNKSLSLSDREKDMVLDMIQHLGELHERQ